MFKYLLLILAITTFANARAINETYSNNRIVGGERIEIEQARWQVAILEDGEQVCGGAIITRETVLTAAHCMDTSASHFSIRAGSADKNSGGVVIRVREYINHPEYSDDSNDFDVSIVKLADWLEFNDKIWAIVVAQDDYVVPVGAIATVSGWGVTEEGTAPRWLLRAEVPVVSNEYCNDALGGGITENMICAGSTGKDSCGGDSGGPLVYNNVHIGIVSFGIGCGDEGKPGGYMRSSAFMDFINEHK